MQRKMCRTVARGFTLIELLVVISIIALLVGLLLPALSTAKLTAMNMQAMTNQAGLAKVIWIYAADNNSYGPTDPPVGGVSLGSLAMRPQHYANAGSGSMGVARSASGPGYDATVNNWNGYGKFGMSGWLIYDSTESNTAMANGPIGLGTMIDAGYLPGVEFFFPPVMREAWAGGGAARHWWNATHLWGKLNGSLTPTSTGFPMAASNGSVISGGVYMAGAVGYRGGNWTPNDEGYLPTFAQIGAPGFDAFTQIRTDADQYNARVLLFDVPFENLGARQGGEMHYTLGDGSTGKNKNTKLIGNFTQGRSANNTVYALWWDTTTSFPSIPASAHVGGGSGSPPTYFTATPWSAYATTNYSLGGGLGGWWCKLIEQDLGHYVNGTNF